MKENYQLLLIFAVIFAMYYYYTQLKQENYENETTIKNKPCSDTSINYSYLDYIFDSVHKKNYNIN